jgi:phage portal protein BeeE
VANLLASSVRARSQAARSMTINDYVALLNQFSYQGNVYGFGGVGIQQSMTPGQQVEPVADTLVGYATQAYKANGVVFACMLVRQLVFSAIRFQFQRFNGGRPSELWGDPSLQLFEQPWPSGTTQDLLARMIQDADLAGNFYAFQDTPLARLGSSDGSPELVRLRPDWMQVVIDERRFRGAKAGWRKAGYLYWHDGVNSGNEPLPLFTTEVTHFAPIPDPLFPYRGMSWLTPILREIQSDGLMMQHKQKFFENAATPNLIVRMDPAVSLEAFKKFKAEMDANQKGVEDAYKTMFVAAAADVTVAGSNFEQMDFKTVQGAGETRIAAAAGVPPVVVGLSEGLQGSSLNAGNYGQARRRLADGTMHPLWANAAGSLQQIVNVPTGSRLWYDARDVPFLREDEKDSAQITFIRAQTMKQLLDAGYTADSVTRAVNAEDFSLLQHSGLFSVQLQPPGSQLALTAGGGAGA